MSRTLRGLSEIAGDYDALYCDVWGVLHNGVAVFAEAADALVRFRAKGGAVILVTNSPRPASSAHAQLKALGCPREAYDAVASSGEATRAELQKLGDAPVFHLGPERDRPLFADLDLNLVAIEDAEAVICTGLFDDETERPETYVPMLRAAAERGVVMVCANPDLAARRGDRIIPCAGALAEIHEGFGGTVRRAGKPYEPIYDLARRAVAAEAPRILAVGDGPATDLKGAMRQGLPTLYVHGGLHERDVPLARVDAWLADQGACADYLVDRLRW